MGIDFFPFKILIILFIFPDKKYYKTSDEKNYRTQYNSHRKIIKKITEMNIGFSKIFTNNSCNRIVN